MLTSASALEAFAQAIRASASAWTPLLVNTPFWTWLSASLATEESAVRARTTW
jgi:hypothetical protein